MNRRRTEITESADSIGEDWIQWVDGYPVGEDRQGKSAQSASLGAVIGMQILTGAVEAFVEALESEPCAVTLEFVPVEPARWAELWRMMAHTDALAFRKGAMTVGARKAFGAAGIRVFPERYKDVKTICKCSDWMRPCKHALAVLRVLGLEISRNPMILVKLRGGERDAEAEAVESEIQTGEELRMEAGSYWGERREWESLQSQICAGGTALRLLKRLGSVAVYGVKMDPDLMFKPVYDGVAAEARTMMDAMRRKREQ